MILDLSFSFLALGLLFILLLPLLTYIIDYNNPYEGLVTVLCLSGVSFILSLFFYMIGGMQYGN